MSPAATLLPHTRIAARAANEGIPVAAIARIVEHPYEEVVDTLKEAHARGEIGEMPKPDWPPAAPWSARLPSVPRSANHEDVEFQCRRAFKLTNLEAGFMMVLLRCECADKDKLHNVIESQRRSRQNLPDSSELTDPKMVDVMICKLRKKLKDLDPKFMISTSWGKGYYFEAAVKQQIFALIGGPYATGTDPPSG
jgi:hypothetical protein